MFKTLGEAKAAGYDLWMCPECTAACTFEAMHLCHGDECPARRVDVKALMDMFEFVAPVRRT